MRVCRWCGKEGDWPEVCVSTRDMEDKQHYDRRCLVALRDAGGGEYTVNQEAASSAKPMETAT